MAKRKVKATRKSPVRNKLFNANAQLGPMIFNALVTKSMGLTRHEMRQLGIPFSTSGPTSADAALTSLMKKGLVHVAGFKSGKVNAQGSSIYQLVLRNADYMGVGGNKAIKKRRAA